jgi:hypothetical protein
VAAEDYFDFHNLDDYEYEGNFYDPTTDGRRADMYHGLYKGVVTEAKLKRNQFYVGSPKALFDNWGHENIEAATKHAREMIGKDGEPKFIVQIVRVVRPTAPPVSVEDRVAPMARNAQALHDVITSNQMEVVRDERRVMLLPRPTRKRKTAKRKVQRRKR